MTLFIAIIVLNIANAPWYWYVFAFALWIVRAALIGNTSINLERAATIIRQRFQNHE